MAVEVCCEKCGFWIEESEVEVLAMEEDSYGRDVVTFTCPHCKTKQRSILREEVPDDEEV